MKNIRQITKRIILLIMILLGTLFVSSCLAGSSPSATIEGYLLALAEKDENSAVNLSCVDWEEQALAESASFKTVEVTLEAVECQIDSESSDLSFVSCNGRFVFSYDAGEEQELVLNGRVFKVIKEAGEWRMCGYPE